MATYIIVSIFILFIIVTFVCGIKVIKAGEVGVVERLGKFKKTIQPGVNIITPFIDKVRIVSVKSNTISNSIIWVTSDEKAIKFEFSVTYRVVDPVKACYNINDLNRSAAYISAAALKAPIEKTNYDEIQKSTKKIISEWGQELEKRLSNWGCELVNLDIENIERTESANIPSTFYKKHTQDASITDEKYDSINENPIKS